MAKRIRGRGSRQRNKRQRRYNIRRALELAKKSDVIVTTPPDKKSTDIVDYHPSLKDTTTNITDARYEKQPDRSGNTGTGPTSTGGGSTVTAPPAILSECDKRLIDILSDPAKFAAFSAKISPNTKVVVVK